MPPGFTITTEACRAYLVDGQAPPELAAEVDAHLHTLERAMGRKLGQVDQPLLVSVRSGARFSMPGMMDTVLDIGLNDDSVTGLAAWSGDQRLAWDSYRRLLQLRLKLFGKPLTQLSSAKPILSATCSARPSAAWRRPARPQLFLHSNKSTTAQSAAGHTRL